MNNDGGGIFSYLPQSTEETYFEKLFGTPTGLTFDSIATMYEAEYFAVDSKEDFEHALTTPKHKDLRIIEVKTNRTRKCISSSSFMERYHRGVRPTMEQLIKSVRGVKVRLFHNEQGSI